MNKTNENIRYKVFAYGRYGLIDQKGNQIVPFLYQSIKDIGSDLYVVCAGQHCGCIDAWGNEVLPIKFNNYHLAFDGELIVMEIDNDALIFDIKKCSISGIFSIEGYSIIGVSERLLRIKNRCNKYALVDENALIILPPTYDFIDWFSEGLASVKQDGKYGFINKEGELVISCQYDDTCGFSEGFAFVRKGKEEGWIDTTGKMIIPLNEDMEPWYLFLESGLICFRNKFTGKFGVINKGGEIIISPEYDYLFLDNDNFIIAKENGKYGVIDTQKNIVIPFEYDDIDRSFEGLFCFKLNEKKGFIDKNNTIIIPAIYDSAYPFLNGLSLVTKRNSWGYIDRQGNEVIKVCQDFDYEKYQPYSYEKKEKWGWYDDEDFELIPPKEKQEIRYYGCDCRETGNIKIGSEQENVCFINGVPTTDPNEIVEHYISVETISLVRQSL